MVVSARVGRFFVAAGVVAGDVDVDVVADNDGVVVEVVFGANAASLETRGELRADENASPPVDCLLTAVASSVMSAAVNPGVGKAVAVGAFVAPLSSDSFFFFFFELLPLPRREPLPVSELSCESDDGDAGRASTRSVGAMAANDIFTVSSEPDSDVDIDSDSLFASVLLSTLAALDVLALRSRDSPLGVLPRGSLAPRALDLSERFFLRGDVASFCDISVSARRSGRLRTSEVKKHTNAKSKTVANKQKQTIHIYTHTTNK